jgi:hypothetical protein
VVFDGIHINNREHYDYALAVLRANFLQHYLSIEPTTHHNFRTKYYQNDIVIKVGIL